MKAIKCAPLLLVSSYHHLNIHNQNHGEESHSLVFIFAPAPMFLILVAAEDIVIRMDDHISFQFTPAVLRLLQIWGGNR